MPPPAQESTPAAEACQMVRRARKASLATLDSSTSYPYASLVAIATDPSGAPILLLSRLALHTRNIAADPRASLLIEAPERTGDPLAGGRVTLMGKLHPVEDQVVRRRFLAVHPTAVKYAQFSDFSFFELELERAHYVGGFGRICALSPPELLVDVGGAGELIAAEPELIAACNRDRAEAVARLGARLSGKEGGWRLTGLDPSGMDLALGHERIRWSFEVLVNDLVAAREQLRTVLGASR